MDLPELVALARDHYVEQFRDFVARQYEGGSRGASEVKLQVSDESRLFRQLYCADFMKNELEAEVVEFVPERVLKFDPILGMMGTMDITIEHLHWDDVRIEGSADIGTSEALAEWFDYWFDLEETRLDSEAELSETIHSLITEEGRINIDLGTAPVDAFWSLLGALADSGESAIRITAARVSGSE